MNDVKDLIDGIIDRNDMNYPEPNKEIDPSMNVKTFDKEGYRNKLSMFVLKDIVCAMMNDETQDINGMIDASIMKHINDNYNGSCFGYLCKARDDVKSPVIGDIIQEIENATNDVKIKITIAKDDSLAEPTSAKEILDNVDNYEDLRKKLADQVKSQVINDVTRAVVNSSGSNGAPTFNIDNVDVNDKPAADPDKAVLPENDATMESVILRACSQIVTESYREKNPVDNDTAMNMAIVEYCICQMDRLFKQRTKNNFYVKYAR